MNVCRSSSVHVSSIREQCEKRSGWLRIENSTALFGIPTFVEKNSRTTQAIAAPPTTRMKRGVASTISALYMLAQPATPFLNPAIRLRGPHEHHHQPSSEATRGGPAEEEDGPALSAASSRTSSWQSHVSTHPDAISGLTKLLDNLNLKDNPPDIAFLFVSKFHSSAFERVVQQASAQLTQNNNNHHCRLVSVVGGGVIGEHSELDEPSKPGMSLLVGHSLPPSSFEIFDFNEMHKPPPEVGSPYWWKLTADTTSSTTSSSSRGNSDLSTPSCLLFADPWSPVENVTAALGNDAVIAGGISVPSGTWPTVAIDDRPLPQGSLVGVCLKAPMKLQVVVAQGCRPVGPKGWTITAAEGSRIMELDGKPALSVLQNFVASIDDTDEQTSISSGLVCGIQSTGVGSGEDHNSVIDDDYLIRQILGFVPSRGGIAVAGGVHVGDRLRFHVRDPQAAREDLQLMMQRARTERTVFGGGGSSGLPVAAIQISCIARGRGLFGDVNVDLEQAKSLLESSDESATTDSSGSIAVGGFFANGEIGPVGIAGFSSSSTGGSGTHLHGFTTVIAYLCDTSSVGDDGESNIAPNPTSQIDEPENAWG